MQSLSSNYYACLSLLPCQVKEHESNISPTTTSRIDPETTIPPANANKIARQWARKLSQRQQSCPDLANKIDTAANITDVAPPPGGMSSATMMTYFVKAWRTAPFLLQWGTVVAPWELARQTTRVGRPAVPPTNSSSSPAAR
jgi:hypothetical protein